MNQYTNMEDRERNFINRLFEKDITIKYVSGYTHSESPVLLECNICGCQFKRLASIVRKGHNLSCPECEKYKLEIEKRRLKLLKQQEEDILNIKKAYIKEIRQIEKFFHRNTIHISRCVRCGIEYQDHSTSKYCAKCRNKIRDKHSGKSLKKLYIRDKGICHICGCECNWNDKKIHNGTIVVGDKYPSIDHIIPLSKGGNDDWENLQLTCFKCNWVKGAC